MDTPKSVVMSSLQGRKTPTKPRKAQHKKSTRNPIKVVYISNPMKFSVAAAEFRALVQEHTGQDADSPPYPSGIFPYSSGSDSVGGGDQTASSETKSNNENSGSSTATCDDVRQVVEGDSDDKDYYKWEEHQIGSGMEWFEAFDDDVDAIDVFTATHVSGLYQSSLLA